MQIWRPGHTSTVEHWPRPQQFTHPTLVSKVADVVVIVMEKMVPPFSFVVTVEEKKITPQYQEI